MNSCPIFRIPRLMWLPLSAADLHILSLRNYKFFVKIGTVKSTLHLKAYVEFDCSLLFYLIWEKLGTRNVHKKTYRVVVSVVKLGTVTAILYLRALNELLTRLSTSVVQFE